jgi:hypothetical protein
VERKLATRHQRGGSHALVKYVDNELGYGRKIIKSFLESIYTYQVLVDIGAGRGADLAIAHEISPVSELFGVECDPDSAFEMKNKGYKIININIEKHRLPFASETVDVFIANQVIEHVKDFFWIFHEMTRCLK